jgi:hypothetical protein
VAKLQGSKVNKYLVALQLFYFATLPLGNLRKKGPITVNDRATMDIVMEEWRNCNELAQMITKR